MSRHRFISVSLCIMVLAAMATMAMAQVGSPVPLGSVGVATDPWYVQGQGQGTTEVGQGAGQTNYNTLVNGWIAAYAVVTTHDNWINYNIMQPPAGTFSAPYARYAFSAAGAGTLALPGEVGGQNNLYTIDGTDSASMDLAGFRVHTNARLDLAIDLGGWMTRVTSTGTPFAGIDTRKAEVWSGAAGPYQLRNQYKLKFKGKYLQYVSAADPAQDAAGTSTFEITPEQAQQGYTRLSGPFQSLTIGLSLAVNNEMTAISAAPGGFRTGWVTVMNHEDAHVQVTAEAVDTVMDADGVLSPHVLADDKQLPVAQWLRLQPAEFNLPPRGQRRVQYTVAPPAELTCYRDLVGLLQFRARKLDALAQQAENEVVGETGSLLIVSLAGAATRAVDIGKLEVDSRPELPGVVRFGIPLRNSGDIHFFPVVTLQLQGVTDPAYHRESQQGLGESRALMLPSMQRMMWVPLPQENLRPGRYRATVLVDYGAQTAARKEFTVDLADTTSPRPGAAQPG